MAVAATVLEIEAIGNTVSTVMGWGLSIFRQAEGLSRQLPIFVYAEGNSRHPILRHFCFDEP
jgi:hypothetical protein